MAKNNPAQDRYNPPSNLENEYELINSTFFINDIV